MKRIENIKEFEDIDTYYEISKIVEEVFQDRVEAHKHLVTANKEIERLTAESTEWESKYYDMQDNYHNANEEIERLNNIINELEKWLEDKNKNALQDDNYWEVLNKLQELKGSESNE